MRFLLTNDDGIEAPGLAILADALREVGEVSVVAPESHLSGCSHQVSSGRALKVRRLGEDRHAVDGTPADCTRLGLLHLAPAAEWVVAGLNDGGNLGVDVYMSGTVAGVREGVLFGKPGIAFSQYRRYRDSEDWSGSADLVRRVLRLLLSGSGRSSAAERPGVEPKSLSPGAFWNVNFPDPAERPETPEIVFCPLESGHLPVRYEYRDGLYRYRGIYQERPRREGSDVDVCFSGRIAITEVRHP